MKPISGTARQTRSSGRAIWIPALAGVALWIAFPARHAISTALRDTPLVVADMQLSSGSEIAQSDEGGGQLGVPPDQVEKYINVYKAMQQNHSLTIDQAASQQGLTVEQFRDIEGKIERDDMLREHVRQVLSKKSNPDTP